LRYLGLTPLDFFLWGYVMSIVYGPTGQVDNEEELHITIAVASARDVELCLV
jgi:hypothetical protein